MLRRPLVHEAKGFINVGNSLFVVLNRKEKERSADNSVTEVNINSFNILTYFILQKF